MNFFKISQSQKQTLRTNPILLSLLERKSAATCRKAYFNNKTENNILTLRRTFSGVLCIITFSTYLKSQPRVKVDKNIM